MRLYSVVDLSQSSYGLQIVLVVEPFTAVLYPGLCFLGYRWRNHQSNLLSDVRHSSLGVDYATRCLVTCDTCRTLAKPKQVMLVQP